MEAEEEQEMEGEKDGVVGDRIERTWMTALLMLQSEVCGRMR